MYPIALPYQKELAFLRTEQTPFYSILTRSGTDTEPENSWSRATSENVQLSRINWHATPLSLWFLS